MTVVFNAQNIMEAYLIKGLLASEDITAHISGEFLQGGIGELPAINLISVAVSDEDADSARKVIEKYERGEYEQ